jgi:CDP-4-dehydro-6-deoxyglucose reductase
LHKYTCKSAKGNALPKIATMQEEPFAVSAVERCTPTIVEVRLQTAVRRLEFLPGQYALVEDCEHAVPPRSYSIANAPRSDGALSLLVTRVEGGATSGWLQDLCPRTHVAVSGPYGTFTDEPSATAPALMLGGGSGLAPLRALLQSALDSGKPHRFTRRRATTGRPAGSTAGASRRPTASSSCLERSTRRSPPWGSRAR